MELRVESVKVFLFNVGERLTKGCNFICNVETFVNIFGR